MQEYFQYCSSEAVQPYIFFFTDLCFGIFEYYFLSGLRYVIQQICFFHRVSCKCQMILSSTGVQLVTLLISVITATIYMFQAGTAYKSLSNCNPWRETLTFYAILNWLMTFLNVVFFIRMLMLWFANNYYPGFILTIRDSWLFMNSILNVSTNQYLYAFEFLVIHRLLDKHFEIQISILLRFFNIKQKSIRRFVLLLQIIFSLFFIASIFQIGDEYDTNFGIDKSNMEIKRMQTLWDYSYFSVITLTGIGYGDIVPKTTFGRIVVAFAIILTLSYFLDSVQEGVLIAKHYYY